jgi:hypothetical protein
MESGRPRIARLATHFYDHLSSLDRLGQFIILANATPPFDLTKTPKIEIFTARHDLGRYGLFPPKNA